ncbi:hypothetical protein Q4F19_16670 [Sphingomonas sp. BIUV-7]|uniref:Uncharacterized protein n=1 Tax=Sphingomonas natans TaxID=3063330 RepID=A0ABT8YCF4_9SPHN|nr:hypothetical protein [Sphingomonas sp. BIUV-7]MDO6416026.1 hypothetical protein [Sphingomonas sp. BIUV-7]
MGQSAQLAEVDRNYDAFVRNLSMYLQDHRGAFALMKNANVIGFYGKPGDAFREGAARFPDGIFSIQEVTDEPIDLGFLSHVGN